MFCYVMLFQSVMPLTGHQVEDLFWYVMYDVVLVHHGMFQFVM